MSFTVAMVGAGRLGLPVAMALAEKFRVKAFDLSPERMKKRQYDAMEKGPNLEDDFQERFDRSTLEFCPLKECVESADIIFIATQTPHAPEFDGTRRLGTERRDFDYSHLSGAATMIAGWVKPHQTVAIISTVLPGTMRRVVQPILGDKCRLAYSPLFIAMSTVMYDYTHPEFVLIGEGKKGEAGALVEMYRTFYDERTPPIKVMSWESAELTKCCGYNALISAKVMFGNAIMEVAHKIPHCNCDDVIDAISCATDRVISPKYLRGGGPDAGNCHPRDLIAMSWLERTLHINASVFENIAQAREKQTEWLVNLFCQESRGLPKVILGKAYKPGVNITTGSGATLMANMLRERGMPFIHHDPICGDAWLFKGGVPKAYLVATKHECFKDFPFEPGSIVVDPFRYIPKRDDITVIPVGVGV